MSLSIRKHLSRDDIISYDDLINKARAVEDTLGEEEEDSNKKKQTSELHNKQRLDRPKCHFCKNYGHVMEQCRKRNKSNAEPRRSDIVKIKKEPEAEDPPRKPTFSCYGCGAPGVIKSACPKCKPSTPQTGETSMGAFDLFSVEPEQRKLPQPRERPVLLIDVNGCKGYGLIDVGAKQSVMGYRLYQMLLKKKQMFQEETVKVKLADGETKERNVLYAT